MNEDGLGTLFSLFQMPVTAYGLCVALAAGISLAVFAWRAKRQGIRENAAMIFTVLCLPLGLIGARLFYCLTRFSFFQEIGLIHILYCWDGGYALWGAAGGVALAAVIAAKLGRVPLSGMMDCLAAPAALAIALCRFAEYFSGEGYGLYVEREIFQFFPLAVSKFGDWRWAVFMLEGGAALAIFVLTLRYRGKRPGDKARVMLILFCASQIFLESIRQDSFLRWDVRFIRISELPATFLLAVMMGRAMARRIRAGNLRPGKAALISAAFLAFIGVFIWMEFAVQKSAELPVWACYTIEAVCCAGLGAAAWRTVLKA